MPSPNAALEDVVEASKRAGPKDRASILRAWDAGEKLEIIAYDHGCTPAYVSKVARAANRPPRSDKGGRPRKTLQ